MWRNIEWLKAREIIKELIPNAELTYIEPPFFVIMVTISVVEKMYTSM
jgi:hypothetical protein